MSDPDNARPLSKQRLRLWLRLLTSTTLIEQDIRNRLREDFKTTLPQFDLMAVLYREPEGVTMSELSRRLLVSNGNITGLADRLEKNQMVKRWSPSNDRRTSIIGLTDKGKKAFSEMAEVHETWVDRLLTTVDEDEIATMMALLGKVKGSADDIISGGSEE